MTGDPIPRSDIIAVVSRLWCEMAHPRQKKPCGEGAHTEWVKRTLDALDGKPITEVDHTRFGPNY